MVDGGIGRGREGRSEGEERLTYNCGPAKEKEQEEKGVREGWNGYCESQAAAAVLCLSECGVGAGVAHLSAI